MNKKGSSSKINIILIFLIIISLSGFGGYVYIKDKKEDKKNIENNENISTKEKNKTTNNENDEEELSKNDEKEEKDIDQFKKNIIAKGLIIKGDIHLENYNYIFALQKFLNANRKISPNNPKILSKIAHTYFLMKNYNSAYKYYQRIEDKNYIDYDKKVLSLIYKEEIDNIDLKRNEQGSITNQQSLQKIEELKAEIKTINLDSENKFYYLNSLECIKNFNNCKINFENHFKKEEYSGKNENLERIRNAINNYENLKLDQIYYKNTLILGAFFENSNFPVTIILGNDILNERPGYKPVLKILAQSYFEINKLEEANEFLIEYAKVDSSSADVSYMIGVISQKNHDYVKSNIFLNLAIEQGYKDIEKIYRLQLYNYLILNQSNKISKTFDKIIELNENPDANDLILATYYSIINGENAKANVLADKGIELYSEKEDFYGFKAWLKIEEDKLEEAIELLNKAKEINPRNALVVLNLGRISKIKYEKEGKAFDKVKASFLFKKAIELDSAEIGELSKDFLNELKEIEDKKKKEEKNSL